MVTSQHSGRRNAPDVRMFSCRRLSSIIMFIEVVWILVVSVGCAQADGGFHMRPEFADRLCIPEFNSSLWNFSLPLSLGGWSDIACTSMCSGTPGCKGVFYNGGKKTCLGGSHVFENTTYCQDDPGSVYFTVETVPYNTTCDGLLPCSGDNMVCWEGDKCVCEPGYSLWPSRTACLADCSEVNITLGPTFQAYPGWRMTGLNLKSVASSDRETCKQLCVDWSASSCTGIDFRTDNNHCNLNRESPLTDSSAFSMVADREYYHRNCQ